MARTTTVKQATATKTISAAKADNPLAVTNATMYTGATLDLSTKVSGAQGTVTYAIKTNGTSTASTLSGSTLTAGAMNASNDNNQTVVITVSAAGNTNYSAGSKELTITVQKYTRTLAFKSTVPATIKYNSTATAAVDVTGSGGTAGSVSYSSGTTSVITVSGTTLKAVAASGSSVITATMARTTTVKQATATKTISAAKADSSNPTLSDVSAVYDGSAHAIGVSGGSGGTIYYSTSTDNSTWGSWSTTKPSLVNVGTLYVKAYVKGDSNHNDTSATGSKKITITQATPTLTLSATGASVSYNNGTGNFTATPSVAGTLAVSSGNATYVTITSGNGASVSANTASSVGYKATAYSSSAITITVTLNPTSNNYKSVSKTYSVTTTDGIAPTLSVKANTTYAKSQTVKFTLEDAGSGLKAGTYTINYTVHTSTTASTTPIFGSAVTITISSNGTKSGSTTVSTSSMQPIASSTGVYHVRAYVTTAYTDVAGNAMATGSYSSNYVSGAQYLDNTAPTATWTAATYAQQNAITESTVHTSYASYTYSVTLSVTESHSGMAGYYIGSTSSTTPPATSSSSWTNTTSKTLTISMTVNSTTRVWFKDNAGNIGYKDIELRPVALSLEGTSRNAIILFPTLDKAVDSTTTGKVHLLKSTVEKVTNTRGSSLTVTVNLHGHSVENSGSDYVFENYNNSVLILQGDSSSNTNLIGSFEYRTAKGIKNYSGSVLTCKYVHILAYGGNAIYNAGTTTLTNSYATAISDQTIENQGGTLNITSSEIRFSGGSDDAIYVNYGTLNVNSGTTITNGNVDSRCIGAWNDAVVNIKGGTITGSAVIESAAGPKAVVAHHGSGTINMTGGTVKNEDQTYALYVDSTASMTVSGGTITNEAGTAALGSRSTNQTEVIKVTGGTIRSSTGNVVFIERIGSGISYVRLYGGTLIAENTHAIRVSGDTTGFYSVYVGNKDTTYSNYAVTLVGGNGYALVSGVSSRGGIYFGNGRIFSKQSSTTPVGSGCSISVNRSGYSRSTTGSYSIYDISGLYQSLLKAN